MCILSVADFVKPIDFCYILSKCFIVNKLDLTYLLCCFAEYLSMNQYEAIEKVR